MFQNFAKLVAGIITKIPKLNPLCIGVYSSVFQTLLSHTETRILSVDIYQGVQIKTGSIQQLEGKRTFMWNISHGNISILSGSRDFLNREGVTENLLNTSSSGLCWSRESKREKQRETKERWEGTLPSYWLLLWNREWCLYMCKAPFMISWYFHKFQMELCICIFINNHSTPFKSWVRQVCPRRQRESIALAICRNFQLRHKLVT